MSEQALPQEAITAFHVMWDNFPEPASLVHKSRKVVAVNKAHFLRPGVVCARLGRGGPHKGCLADKALKDRAAATAIGRSPVEEKEMITYWIPLEGYPDHFIHTSIRFKVDHDAKSVGLSPISEEAREYYRFDPDGNEET